MVLNHDNSIVASNGQQESPVMEFIYPVIAYFALSCQNIYIRRSISVSYTHLTLPTILRV